MTVLIDPHGHEVDAAESIVEALIESGYSRPEETPPAKSAKK